MTNYRTEVDSMGEVQVPVNAYYSSQTQRAVENFPISGWRLPTALIRGMGRVKLACAIANNDLGKLTGSGKNTLNAEQVKAMFAACQEVIDGKMDGEFPVDVFQTGSGTSSNMNINEVISNRAIELMGGDRFSKTKSIHPNDHVNMGQSTNDTFPTAIHVATACEIHNTLIPQLVRLGKIMREKAQKWDKIIKIGRTHLMDATPLRLGQEFGGFARQVELSIERAKLAAKAVLELPVGGTAVGSGINTHPAFGRRVSENLAKQTGIPFVEAVDHFEANAQRDGLVESHGQIKSIAMTLFNVANNIRWLGSGPRCGFYEVILPDRQPGSSIMPGKVNPVIPEVVNQVCFDVIGGDMTVTMAAEAGQLQLNVFEPVIAFRLLRNIQSLRNACVVLRERCIDGITANPERMRQLVEHSIGIVTALVPILGYEKCAEVAMAALQSGRGVYELVLERGWMQRADLERALNPASMTGGTT